MIMKRKREIIVLAFIAAVMLSTGNTKADFTFGTPVPVPNINSEYLDGGPRISADDLSLFFGSGRPGGEGHWDLWVSTRTNRDDSWGEPENLGPTVNSSAEDAGPSISTDGLSLYFYSERSGGYKREDIWVTTRATPEDEWGEPKNLGPNINSMWGDAAATLSADGLTLYFCSDRPIGLGHDELWVTRRQTVDDDWGPAETMGPPICSQYGDYSSDITPDGLIFFFSDSWDRPRPNGLGLGDIFVSRRSSIYDPWGEPVNLGARINSPSDEGGVSISADASIIYFHSNRPGGPGDLDLYDIWQAPIEPVVDLNGDGIVDTADMCIIVDHWGEYYPLCDIGPTPLGDGIVDVQDLIVIAGYLKPSLIAHWTLDESEGTVAADSAGNNDAFVASGAIWEPDGGQVDGAIRLDGIDDYVSTPFILDTIKGSLSAFAWIKGGGPGQVIVSQTNGTGWGGSWLCADSSNGRLATVLMDPQPALVSESVITDGAWHHIGLVWDKSYRYLYVDGAEVARDVAALSYTVPCDGGLYLGVGKTLDAGSFFSGLIDDVRIYNRVVKP